MFRRTAIRGARLESAFLLICAAFPAIGAIHFESAAQLHRTLRKPIPGTLVFDETGVEFRAPKLGHQWPYGDIKTLTISGPRALTLTDYENRHWHEPGEQKFSFTLATPISPELAAQFVAAIERPVINRDPEPRLPSWAEIPAHRREIFGASNGTLRFRDGGVDYLTTDARAGRSWRWSDIQTIASSDRWQFRITAYREIVEFDLKQPISRELFDRVWDRLYATDLNLNPDNEAAHGGHR
jgi:hypothetical protein